MALRDGGYRAYAAGPTEDVHRQDAHGSRTHGLLDQVWVKDPEQKKDIRSLLTDLVAKTGENVRVRRFVRYEVGEGLEKRPDDFAAEVKKQAEQA